MFDLVLQLHKKGSSNTTVRSYTLTPEERRLQRQAVDYSEAVSPNALWLNNVARNILQDSIGATQVDFNQLNQNAQGQIANAQQGVQGLINGQLPTAYTQNMQNQIQQGVNSSMGNMLNTLGANGVLNSSVTNKGIADINDAASQAMANAYTNNIGLLSQLYGQQMSGANAGISTGAAAQEAAQQPALNLWNASLGLNGATNSALAGVSGQGTTTATQKTSGGSGLFGGLLAGYASNSGGIFCFTGNTKIKTPNGTKKISAIKAGDKVICPSKGGNETVETVVDVLKNGRADTFRLIAFDGDDVFKVDTTFTQPFIKEDGTLATLKELHAGDTILTESGTARVFGYAPLETARVYDMKLTGDNRYYANGIVAVGGTDEW